MMLTFILPPRGSRPWPRFPGARRLPPGRSPAPRPSSGNAGPSARGTRRPAPAATPGFPSCPGAGRRQARAPRAADLVRARQEGVPGVAAGAGRRVPRADGPALPDDGRGAGERPGGKRCAAGDRGHRGDPRGGSMKVSIIGGGPGGLYFALLAKKAWPRWEITVYERNRPDDTFGFGVVFSDQTLDTFKT